jgi:hypothetical protein
MYQPTVGDRVLIDCTTCSELGRCEPPADGVWTVVPLVLPRTGWCRLRPPNTPYCYSCPVKQLRLAQRMVINGNELTLEES